MATIEVRRKEGESIGSLMRRFSRLVKASGLVGKVRSLRFRTSDSTRRQRRLSALHREQMRKHHQQLYKLGKSKEEEKRRR